MYLSDLPLHQKGKIINFECSAELKQRFYSFGIMKNVIVFVENISFSKNTIEIDVDETLIGLRLDEARTIEIEPLITTTEDKKL